MKIRAALAPAVAFHLAGPAPAAERITGTWWDGVAYSGGSFHPRPPAAGRPPLVPHSDWGEEKAPRGTLIRVGKGYLTVDEKGVVHVSAEPSPGSYWVKREVKRAGGRHDDKTDWRGTWKRTTYTLEPTAPGLRGGRLGFRDGSLTVHPGNDGLAILAVSRIDAEEISGK